MYIRLLSLISNIFLNYTYIQGTYYCDVKLLRVTSHGYVDRHRYINFQSFSSKIKTKRVVLVTFQTKILVCCPEPRPKYEIMFVRIKPHHKRRQTSESDHDADIYQQRLSQLVETYIFLLIYGFTIVLFVLLFYMILYVCDLYIIIV